MKAFMEKVNAAVTYNNLSFQIIQGSDKETELLSYLESASTDVIVFSTHKRTFFEKIFGVSLTRQIALNSTVPVMAFHTVPKAPIVL